jgi:hypothetical protein
MPRNGPANPITDNGSPDARMVLNSDRTEQKGLRLDRREIEMLVVLKVRKRQWENKIVGEALAHVFNQGWEHWLAERREVARYAAAPLSRRAQFNTKLSAEEVSYLEALKVESGLAMGAVIGVIIYGLWLELPAEDRRAPWAR